MSDLLDMKNVESSMDFAMKLKEQDQKYVDATGYDEIYDNLVEAEDASANLMNHYKDEITLTDAEMDALIKNDPPQPGFKILTKEEYNNKSCGKKSYMKKVKKFYQDRQNHLFKKDKNGKTVASDYAKVRYGIEKRIEYEKAVKVAQEKIYSDEFGEKQKEKTNEEVNEALKEGYYPEFKTNDDGELCEMMDKEYARFKEDQSYQNTEQTIMGVEKDVYMYVSDGRIQSSISDMFGLNKLSNQRHMRNGMNFPQAKKMTEIMKKQPLNRNLVTRTGISGEYAKRTLAHMLGEDNDVSMEVLKKKLQDGIANKGKEDLLLKDDAYFNTYLPGNYTMDSAGSDKEFGVEFVVLAKKGSAAMHTEPFMNSVSLNREGELVFAPKTQFRVLDVKFEGASFAEEERAGKKTWKIYMVPLTVDEMEKKENNTGK